jgi:hypothetical protein
LFRRALAASPTHTEARIRLGRVLGQRGRHEEAVRELRQALVGTKEELLQYFGHLFLGAAWHALSSADDARQAYERAAALYPRAQSPRIGLSVLAAASGDRQTAREVLQVTLVRDDVSREDDPWWSYSTSQARIGDQLLSQLYALAYGQGR